MTGRPEASDPAAVAAANEAFYRAFESLDLEEMDRVWAHDDRVACVHPGWRRLQGWEEVRPSWANIFANTSEMRFTVTDVRVEVVGDVAWVHCTENILSEVRGSLAITSVLATNVFERYGARWLMVHHHASHVLAAGGGRPDEP